MGGIDGSICCPCGRAAAPPSGRVAVHAGWQRVGRRRRHSVVGPAPEEPARRWVQRRSIWDSPILPLPPSTSLVRDISVRTQVRGATLADPVFYRQEITRVTYVRRIPRPGCAAALLHCARACTLFSFSGKSHSSKATPSTINDEQRICFPTPFTSTVLTYFCRFLNVWLPIEIITVSLIQKTGDVGQQ